MISSGANPAIESLLAALTICIASATDSNPDDNGSKRPRATVRISMPVFHATERMPFITSLNASSP